jgi:hypothetical protein
MTARLLFFLSCGTATALDDFRPMVAEAMAKGEKKIVIHKLGTVIVGV